MRRWRGEIDESARTASQPGRGGRRGRACRADGDARKGNRPSYVEAAPGEVAEPLYDRFCERLGAKKGEFGACMGVALVNDGPVTLLVEV